MDAAKKKSAQAINELDEPLWSVVSFERVEGAGLTYDSASELMNNLDQKRVAGLCIVTIDAASRVKTRE